MYVKVEFEKEFVRVHGIRLNPHEKIPMHEHPARAVVSLTNTDVASTMGTGRAFGCDTCIGNSRLEEAEMLINRPRGPFCYQRLCLDVAALMLLFALATTVYFVVRPGGTGVLVIAVPLTTSALVSVATYLALYRVLGKHLPPTLRRELPYDFEDARQGKGSIRSYGDLFRSLRGHSLPSG
jgi:hypothetical protein